MARILKFSGYAVDHCEWYDEEKFTEDLENEMDLSTQHLHVEYADIEWEDESPLNYPNCDLAYCEKYFKSEPTKMGDRYPEVGAMYRHFKEGKIVKVLAVAQDTENVGSYSVIYTCYDEDNVGKVWSRPYEMFMSEVDRVKYPEAKQKYRFEKVAD